MSKRSSKPINVSFMLPFNDSSKVLILKAFSLNDHINNILNEYSTKCEIINENIKVKDKYTVVLTSLMKALTHKYYTINRDIFTKASIIDDLYIDRYNYMQQCIDKAYNNVCKALTDTLKNMYECIKLNNDINVLYTKAQNIITTFDTNIDIFIFKHCITESNKENIIAWLNMLH